DPRLEGEGLHGSPGRTEFPLCLDDRRPPLHRRARPRRRQLRQCRSGAKSRQTARLSRGLRTEERKMKLRGFAAFAAALMISAAAQTDIARAQISGDTVKIGVLNDMSGLYAD